jgi:hypothetical protein
MSLDTFLHEIHERYKKKNRLRQKRRIVSYRKRFVETRMVPSLFCFINFRIIISLDLETKQIFVVS